MFETVFHNLISTELLHKAKKRSLARLANKRFRKKIESPIFRKENAIVISPNPNGLDIFIWKLNLFKSYLNESK